MNRYCQRTISISHQVFVIARSTLSGLSSFYPCPYTVISQQNCHSDSAKCKQGHIIALMKILQGLAISYRVKMKVLTISYTTPGPPPTVPQLPCSLTLLPTASLPPSPTMDRSARIVCKFAEVFCALMRVCSIWGLHNWVSLNPLQDFSPHSTPRCTQNRLEKVLRKCPLWSRCGDGIAAAEEGAQTILFYLSCLRDEISSETLQNCHRSSVSSFKVIFTLKYNIIQKSVRIMHFHKINTSV